MLIGLAKPHIGDFFGLTDGRLTLGYFTFVGGNLVTWKSKKEKW